MLKHNLAKKTLSNPQIDEFKQISFNKELLHFQKLAKSEEENVAGNYFKSQRALKLVAQAQEAQKCNVLLHKVNLILTHLLKLLSVFSSNKFNTFVSRIQLECQYNH